MPTSLAPNPPPRDRKPVRRARRTALIALCLLLVLGAAWSGIWYVFSSRVEARIDAAIAREARAGLIFSCGARQVFGFPFRVAMRCEAPKLEIERPAGKVALAATRLTGVAQVYDPDHVIVEAVGPLSIEAPGLFESEADWRSLLVSFVARNGAIDHADMAVEAPSLRMRDGQNMLATNAEGLELHLRRDPQRPAQDDAVEIAAKLVHLASPVLDAFAGDATSADLDVNASVSQVASLQVPRVETAPPALERWRLAGGGVHVAGASLAKGSLKASFTGDLALDELHRASGRLDASLEGAEALLPRLGLPPTAAAFLKLGGGKLRLPLTMTNGRMAVGPISVGRLIPLY